MIEHSCCCIIFCIVCTFWKYKREFKIHLKICFELLKRKRKEISFPDSVFGPAQQSPPGARPLFFSTWPASSSRARSFLGPSPAAVAGPTRERAVFPPPPVTDFAGPRVSRIPFLKPPSDFLSLFLPIRIRLHISPLPCLEHSRAIKTELLHLPAPHSAANRSPNALWWPRPKFCLHRPSLRAARAPRFVFGLGFALGEIALMHSTRWCFSFAR
jgi:hypothetical protein